MEETFSQNFKKVFLLNFAKELIVHSAERDIMKLQSIIESKEQKRKEKTLSEPTKIFTRELEREVKEIKIPVQKIFKKTIRIPPAKKPIVMEINPRSLPRPPPGLTRPIVRRPLFIPEPKLPSHLEYLKPIPTAGVEIDLFKLNPLIRDVAVRIIEVNPDEGVIVSGTMGTRPTDIILSKEDIDRVINKFVEVSKIPANEGIYKVVIGNLIVSAIISETVGSRFIIKKMIINPNLFENQQQKHSTLPFQDNNLR